MRVEYEPEFYKEYARLAVRNPVLHHRIEQKVPEILKNPYHYKPLRGRMKGFRRVHFGSYVLVYRVEEEVLYLVALDHHDFAY
jgi:YafQ family addiction module toxin component